MSTRAQLADAAHEARGSVDLSRYLILSGLANSTFSLIDNCDFSSCQISKEEGQQVIQEHDHHQLQHGGPEDYDYDYDWLASQTKTSSDDDDDNYAGQGARRAE